jgi:hypothetical protein
MFVGLAFLSTQRHQKVRVPRSVTRHELLVEKVQYSLPARPRCGAWRYQLGKIVNGRTLEVR